MIQSQILCTDFPTALFDKLLTKLSVKFVPLLNQTACHLGTWGNRGTAR